MTHRQRVHGWVFVSARQIFGYMSDGFSWLSGLGVDPVAAPNAEDASEKDYHLRASPQKTTVQRRDGAE
jgi:hypothetical protein